MLEEIKEESEEMIPKQEVEGLLAWYKWALRQDGKKKSLEEIQTELKKHWIPLSTVEARIKELENMGFTCQML